MTGDTRQKRDELGEALGEAVEVCVNCVGK